MRSLFFLWLLFSAAALADAPLRVPIPGKQSILRVGALPDPVNDRNRAVAQMIFNGLNGDRAQLQQASEALDPLIDTENLGGSYSALSWIVHMLRTPEADRGIYLKNPLDQHYADFFFANEYAHLKEYLQRKFGINDFRPANPEKHIPRTQFLEDLILFNNPARARWDPVDEVMAVLRSLDLQGKQVIDIGAGFGFYSYRLAQLVGDKGKVYAIDTSEPAVAELKKMVKQYDLGPIEARLSTEEDVKVREPTDLAFIASLYHVLYAWSTNNKRDAFIESLRKTLRPGGYLVILDNHFNQGHELHNSYIDPNFAIAQLFYYGFELQRYEPLGKRRYLLIFRRGDPGQIPPPAFVDVREPSKTIPIEDSRSAVHIGSLDSFDITPPGIKAAENLYQAVEAGDLEAAKEAIAIYDEIIPKEHFGGEYTALRWLARYLIASPAEQKKMTEDPLVAAFRDYLLDQDGERIKYFLARKYKLGKEPLTAAEAMDEKTRQIGIVRRQSLEDFILFNNPAREEWEKSSEILAHTPIHPGDTVIDVGSGPGYYSFKFAKLVGESGRVYALDTKKPHVDYIQSLVKKWRIENLFAQISSTDGLGLDDLQGQADLVFLCSLYHILYGVSSVQEREGMLRDIRQVLKPGGKLVIVDNGPVEQKTLPYHGPYIRKELIIAQLAEYGFQLREYHQIIPQRYLLLFERMPSEE